MPPKRTRATAASSEQGLAKGVHLDRDKLVGSDSLWGWVGTEAKSLADITLDHKLRTCGLSPHNKRPFCTNIYAKRVEPKQEMQSEQLDADVIDVADTIKPECSKKLCKSNPNCLNHLGQDIWENDGKEAWALYSRLVNLGHDPSLGSRDADTPVGLKNLGATCYANAYLQVWFQNLAFRSGVYSCQPIAGRENMFWDSPIYHLQLTFSALENSTQRVFNPEKLVESLQLRITEQQDAQEFAKLFISHLDEEFGKQPNESLRNLITTQFSGKQIYGTICAACQHTSQTEADFYEIEVNLTENARLEECIQSALQNETLSGDNRYLCPKCASLQDATRFTQLRQLPPVLHLSLLRFFYDAKSMVRKKSKHAMTFPAVLDMTQFVPNQPTQIYDLRGILLHKGTSAHHGHYEAQIFDIRTQKWYQMNDELVSLVTYLGDKSVKNKEVLVVDGNGSDSSFQPAKKRRKMDLKTRKKENALDVNSGDGPMPQLEVTSKDAYMLVYTRREDNNLVAHDSTHTPSWAQTAVNESNKEHKAVCDAYESGLEATKQHFQELRHRMQDVYNIWNCTSDQDEYTLISRQKLENWLSHGAIKSNVTKFCEEEGMDMQSTEPKPGQKAAQDHLICEHHKVKPGNCNLKRVRSSTLDIMEGSSSSLEPFLSPHDICETCLQHEFLERLYRVEHPQAVRQFEQLDEVTEAGYWISTHWLKDWKCMKPKMHTAGQEDPSPDVDPYHGHVCCRHGGLASNSALRRKISPQACAVLQKLFPSWQPLDAHSKPCVICEALNVENQVTKQQAKAQADKEKGSMKPLLEAAQGAFGFLEHMPCSLVPSEFLREWKAFVLRPDRCSRPIRIQTDVFYCEHGLLCFDPNDSADLDDLVVVRREDWQHLELFYPCGPPINVEKRIMSDGTTKFFHDVQICINCRTQRNSNFESTVITVRILDKNTPVPSKGPLAEFPDSHDKSATRKSRRIRRGKNPMNFRRLTVSKNTSVKDIKVMLQDATRIPTIVQRLYYRGQELDVGEATVASLAMLVNDILDMKQVEEGESISDKDDGNEEELGFSGTLLGSRNAPPTADAMRESPMRLRTCATCTFNNPWYNTKCDICTKSLY